MPNVGDLGEFGLIARIRKCLPVAANVIEGIGDDCAVVRIGDTLALLSCDLLIEHVHFRRGTASPEDIGWKAAAAAFSDIAAMGGTPLFGLVSFACSADTDAAYVEDLYRGLSHAAAQAGAVIVGGDTAKTSDALVIDVSVIGHVSEGRYLTRNGAQPGDVLAITGDVGRSAAGLHALEHANEAPSLISAHRRPRPRYHEARWLCRQAAVRAMIDISDGLAQDAGHLTETARIGVDLDPARLVPAPDLERYCRAQGIDAAPFMLAGGEDYELACAIAPEAFADIAAAFSQTFDTALTLAGHFTDKWTGPRIEGEPLAKTGFDHFH